MKTFIVTATKEYILNVKAKTAYDAYLIALQTNPKKFSYNKKKPFCINGNISMKGN